MHMHSGYSLFCPMLILLASACKGPSSGHTLQREDYNDRCKAIWNAQIVSVLLGWQFEHKQAAVKWVDSIVYPTSLDRIRQAGGCAPVDDDWYYEMAALNAFEKYGPEMTVGQLGEQWAKNNVGVWGSSGQARLNILKGINPPLSGHPVYNRLWFTMGAQNRCDLYGALHPGMPNQAAAMARHLQEINSYAEGTDGGVFTAAMISMVFFETDPQKIIRECARILHPETPHRQCIDRIIRMAGNGHSPQEISEAVLHKWSIEYPATNSAVTNMGMGVIALWFGEGDFMKSLNLGFSLQDYTDADCNSTTAAVVLAAMHGMKIIPERLLRPLNDCMKGDMIGPVSLIPPVDTRISTLGERTAAMGERILEKNGAVIQDNVIHLPAPEPIETQEAVLFHPDEFVRYWDPSWELSRAGYGAPGGGHRGIRGGTFIEFEPDTVLVTYPRDETRGVRLKKEVILGETFPKLFIHAGADPGRNWRLEVCVDNDRLLSKLISGGPALDWPGVPDWYFPPPQEFYERSKPLRHYEMVEVDLSGYAGKKVMVRIYQHTLVRDLAPGNAYWKKIIIQ
jgi:hypothetical protein